MVRLLFVFAVFMLVQTAGFGQEAVRYLNARHLVFDSLRDTVPVFFEVDKEVGRKLRSKTYTMDSVIFMDYTRVKDANGQILFSTTLEYDEGKLRKKCDFDGQTNFSDCKYFYKSGKIRTEQKLHHFEVIESKSYDEDGNIVPAMLDFPASAKGGLKGWNEYLSATMVYPISSRKKGEEGTVYLKFVVSELGEISEVYCLNEEGWYPDLVKEAMRVLQEYPYRFTPQTFNGKTEECIFRIPIRFKLSD
jgi:TonB family protein